MRNAAVKMHNTETERVLVAQAREDCCSALLKKCIQDGVDSSMSAQECIGRAKATPNATGGRCGELRMGGES